MIDKLSSIQLFCVCVLPILFAITVHEVAHGWVANKLGDPTARVLGRLTLNPLKHIDLLGTIILPIILMLTSGIIFGWAKPVPVNWENLRRPRRDMALVALAGPLVNLIMAVMWASVAALGAFVGKAYFDPGRALIYMGAVGVSINISFMVLNLIPIPPLDGSRVVHSLLPPAAAQSYSRVEPFGIIILLVLLVSGMLFTAIGPLINILNQLLLRTFL